MADDNLSEVQQFARALHEERVSLGQNRDEITDSLAELHREPRATVELTEDELTMAIAALDNASEEWGDQDAHWTVFNKLQQALAIESGPGGAFVDPA